MLSCMETARELRARALRLSPMPDNPMKGLVGLKKQPWLWFWARKTPMAIQAIRNLVDPDPD